MSLALLAPVLFAAGAQALDNGFGRTPVLGYNTYNAVSCNPNQTWVSNTINAFADKGFRTAGYQYFQIDCGWQAANRAANGSLTYDTSTFPDGIRPLADLAIKRGFQWSMYTDQGVKACDTRNPLPPGSLGYEKQDSLQFAGWNVAYMKLDNCYVTADQNAPKDPRTDFPSRYGAMSTALQNVGIKGMLVCQWGTPYSNSSYGLQGPSAWTPPLANSYRVSDDIATGWGNVARIFNEAVHVNLNGLSGPGHFADMDLLEVGNPGMTSAEQQTHFAIWAFFKSALMVSTPITTISPATQSILQNTRVIAINQDTLGTPVKLVQRFTDDYDTYLGPLANGDKAVLVFDQSNAARGSFTVTFSDLGIASADVTDLYTGAVTRGASSYTVSNLAAHGSIALRLANTRATAAPTRQPTYYAITGGTRTGNANLQSCSTCTSGQKVGNIDTTSSVTISNINAPATTVDVLFDYINCDISYLGSSNTNVRRASISVNGGQSVQVEFPLSGYEWTKDIAKTYKVRLGGFKVGSGNTIRITAVGGNLFPYAPDFDRLAL